MKKTIGKATVGTAAAVAAAVMTAVCAFAAPSLNRTSLSEPCNCRKYPISLKGATDAVTWRSPDSRIAAVHVPAGVSAHTATKAYLVLRHPGTANVTASYKGKTYTCRVTVKGNYVKESSIRKGSSVYMNTYYGAKTYTAHCQGAYGSDYINKHGCGYCAIATVYNVIGKNKVNGKAPASVNGRDVVRALGERTNGIGFQSIPNDLMNRLGIYPKAKSVTLKRSAALAYIERQLASGYPVLAHITNVNMMTGQSAASVGEKLGGDVHIISILGVTDRKNFVIGNPNGTTYGGRQGIQIVPQKVLIKYLLNNRPDRRDAAQVNYVNVIVIDNHPY